MDDGSRGGLIKGQLTEIAGMCRNGWETLRDEGPGQLQFWFLALLIGIAAGFAALFFRKGIEWLQSTLYGAEDIKMIHSFAETLEWYYVLIIPIVGGVIVGLILNRFTDDGRVRSVADVIEGAALGDGRVETKAGVG